MNELYKRSFDKLQLSENFKKELLENMEQKKTRPRLKKCLIMAAAVIAVVTLLTAIAYASGALNLEAIRLWINGEEVDPSAYVDEDGTITVTVNPDEEGDGQIMVQIMDGEWTEEYVHENGRDYLVQENINTGETQRFDITDGDLLQETSVQYEQEGGRDYLVMENATTGETRRVDITDEMVDGEYHGELNIFGVLHTVDVQVTADGVSISLANILPE